VILFSGTLLLNIYCTGDLSVRHHSQVLYVKNVVELFRVYSITGTLLLRCTGGISV
jgi:hypothetical protein